MARPRSFDETAAVGEAARIFAELGFNATSIDDLILATGIQRGSIYKAFGSKRGLFILSLKATLSGDWYASDLGLDLMIVALKELAKKDPEIRNLCLDAISEAWDNNLLDAAAILGARLLTNLEENHG